MCVYLCMYIMYASAHGHVYVDKHTCMCEYLWSPENIFFIHIYLTLYDRVSH